MLMGKVVGVVLLFLCVWASKADHTTRVIITVSAISLVLFFASQRKKK
jgi:hypothetical protein